MRRINDKVRTLGLTEQEAEIELERALAGTPEEELNLLYDNSVRDFEVGTILPGRILNRAGDEFIVDVGYKSEGKLQVNEFDDPASIETGLEVEVLLEGVEDESGLIMLSKRKADRIRGWERVIEQYGEGDVVTGTVMRKIKGGLLVDIGVPVFLPASQINIRRPGDISTYIGKVIHCKILKIDEGRRNIVVSRRQLIEEERAKMKEKLLGEIAIGQVRKGVVKNIADFGAFVDLGGIDGLLHITDMSWGRISHPSELVSLDQEIDIVVIDIDWQSEKIALGLKQLTESPWLTVDLKYPIGSKVRGTVVNVMDYGAFVRLEEGIEGLVHISEMSWTKRLNHPSEMVRVGDEIDVVVLDINKGKQEISLGMKQTEVNPWTLVREKYPPGSIIEGRVRNLTSYGAFVEIEEGIDGLLHISDMSWTKKANHPSELLQKGQKVKAVVLSVDQDRRRVALGVKQLTPDPWENRIPYTYIPGDMVTGKATKITNFGVFVELEEGLEGLLHVSELSHKKVENPEEIVKVGQEITVKIIRVDTEDRKIGLSLKRLESHEIAVQPPASDGAAPSKPDKTVPPAREQAASSESGRSTSSDSDQATASEPGEPTPVGPVAAPSVERGGSTPSESGDSASSEPAASAPDGERQEGSGPVEDTGV